MNRAPRHLFRTTIASALVAATAGLSLATAPAATAQATRTYVSGVGDDVNPCSRTAPCKTFAGAISKTAAGGIINVLDSGGFGTVTIVKSITIDGTGANASVLAPGTNGVHVANADADVVLRNIDISSGNACSATPGIAGVRISAASSVRIENVTINGFNRAVTTPLNMANPDVYVDVTIRGLDAANNCIGGVTAEPEPGKQVRVVMHDSNISTSNQAFVVGPGGEAWVGDSSLSLNNVALVANGGAKIHSLCGNSLVGNATASSFTDAIGDCAPAPVVTPTPAPTTPTTPVVAPATYCTVPKLTGLTVTKARAALTRAGCALGKVAKQKAKKKLRGKVLKQAVPATLQVRTGTRIAVTIGK